MNGRALVLGGGGVTGIAWELGVLAAVARHGVDLLDADLVLGTSAGAAVAAQATAGVRLGELLDAQRTPPHESAELQPDLDLDLLVHIFTLLHDEAVDEQQRLMSVGALALEADTVAEEVRRAVIEARLPSHDWPDSHLEITAVDARTGELVRFDRTSGVALVDAVAASCAVPGVWPAVTIDDRRFIDGGMRSPTNADLAAGHDVVVVLSPLDPVGTPRLGQEVERLRSDGSIVVEVQADRDALEAIGPNPLDVTRRAIALDAGLRQGAIEAGRLAAVWLSRR